MLKENILRIQNEIVQCALSVGRDATSIKLLAVSKTHSADIVRSALSFGIDFIAESRVQECEQKLPALVGLYKEFHFVGHLQSNKINKLLSFRPTLIHSIDKYSTAEKLNNALAHFDFTQDILIEVNTSGEASKHGCHPSDIYELLERIDQLDKIRVKGLMTIGRLTNDTEQIRDCFKSLRESFETAKTRNYHHCSMEYLSMGMSDDFQIAIAEGSNILRVGSAIFGHRDYQK